MAIIKHISTAFQLGDSFDSTIKTANWEPQTYVPPEIQEYIQALQADPRFAYVHTIGMTDGDWYGSNLNGDHFSEEELLGMQSPDEALKNPGAMRGVQQPRYKTFEQAKFFRHHDNRPSSPYYGDIPCAAWNPLMRRVEMVIRIAKDDVPELGMRGAPDIIIKLDRRGYIDVSMGCAITHERCSYCGHENSFVKDRCTHLKNQMNQIMPNGVRAQAQNFGMRFFDLSDVTIPADPGASSLAKVAAYQIEIPPEKLANIAFDEGATMQDIMHEKWSDIVKRAPCGLSAQIPFEEGRKKTPLPALPPGLLKEALLACGGDPSKVASSAAVAGIVFSPHEFGTLLQYAEPGKVAGFDVGLDKISPAVYDALSPVMTTRSGFIVDCPTDDWDPAKVAEAGYPDVAEVYAHYRASVCSLPRESLLKAAHLQASVRGLHEGQPAKIAAGLYHLAHAGLRAPR